MKISLKSARVNKNLVLDEVVKILREKYNYKITRQKLSRYEANSSDISITLAKFLCEIYDTPIDFIFF
ncbi:helix-turn-helix domain-containing protein [Enterococcus cecorum]|uniref:Helix-turn-helix transcriptional regulator n=1 Tax=Enterococcus cecorum TaxID=44008 RepID=A0A7X9NQ27_9ENTE|nr:helix-turn-helix domain-containing protein [Enterococcus cecorum]NME50319.1 helix-turn-helix transcriptional regulator [Enterococcus cecorum]